MFEPDESQYLTDKEYERWRDMLFGHVDEVADALVERYSATVENGVSILLPVDSRELIARLTTMADEQDDKFARLACGLGVISGQEADCGLYTDWWHREADEEVAIARPEEQLEERRLGAD